LIAVVRSRDAAHCDDQQQRRHGGFRPSGAQRHAKRSGNPNYIRLAEDAQIRAEIASAEFEMHVDSHRCFGSPDRLNATSAGGEA
jgi:hypothetical protein